MKQFIVWFITFILITIFGIFLREHRIQGNCWKYGEHTTGFVDIKCQEMKK